MSQLFSASIFDDNSQLGDWPDHLVSSGVVVGNFEKAIQPVMEALNGNRNVSDPRLSRRLVTLEVASPFV